MTEARGKRPQKEAIMITLYFLCKAMYWCCVMMAKLVLLPFKLLWDLMTLPYRFLVDVLS